MGVLSEGLAPGPLENELLAYLFVSLRTSKGQRGSIAGGLRFCAKAEKLTRRDTDFRFRHCSCLLTLTPLTRWLIQPKALDRSTRVCSVSPWSSYWGRSRASFQSMSLTISTAPTKSPFRGGVRTSSRALNSPNWRIKAEDSPGDQSPRSPSQQHANNNNNTTRSPFSGLNAHVSQAIAEGRRLYVGNMPYMAKTEDVRALFATGEYKMCGFSPF